MLIGADKAHGRKHPRIWGPGFNNNNHPGPNNRPNNRSNNRPNIRLNRYPTITCKHASGPHRGSCTYADLPSYWDVLVSSVEKLNAETF